MLGIMASECNKEYIWANAVTSVKVNINVIPVILLFVWHNFHNDVVDLATLPYRKSFFVTYLFSVV